MWKGLEDDLRFAWRMLRKSRAFTATVVLTLALTIALSTTVFSVLEAVFLRPLPYRNVERIVSLRTYSPQGYTQPASYPEYRDWRRDAHSFAALAAYNDFKSVNFEWNGTAVALHSVMTSDNFFDVFSVKPVLGRTFEPGEEDSGRNSVVVLSNEVWRDVCGGKPDVIGAKVKLDGVTYTIIGVMPAGFRFPIGEVSAAYFPLRLTPNQRNGRGNHWLPVVGRLKSGITYEGAAAEFSSVLNALGETYPGTKGRRAKIVDITSFTVGNAAQPLRLLLYAVLVLLAIGCVNIAGLLSARAVRLEREVAVRMALGANRLQFMRQFLLETLLYAGVGGVGGIGLAAALLQLVKTLVASSVQRGVDVSLNIAVLVVSLVASALTGILAGFLPAVRLSATAANEALRTGTRTGVRRGQHRLRASFSVIQIALALMLLATAGLLFRTLAGLRNAPIGFDPDHVVTTAIELSPGSYAKRNLMASFYNPLLERVQSIPGVISAGLTNVVPIQNWGWNSEVSIEGQVPPPPNQERLAEYRIVTPGYHQVFGMRLLRGRLLNPKLDTPQSPRTMVVNETFVHRFIPPGEDPLGKAVRDGDERVSIVGVVSDVRQNIYTLPLAEMAMPISQAPVDEQVNVISSMHLVVRTTGKPEAIVGDLRRAFHEIDPGIPFRTAETMPQIVANTLTFERLENWLFGSFSVLAFLLAIIGLMGLIGEEVSASTREIGVRMALGATRVRVLRLVYARVTRLLVMGLAIGMLGVYSVRQLLASVINAPSIGFWQTSVAGALFALVALVVASAPASRAAATDPNESLRSE